MASTTAAGGTVRQEVGGIKIEFVQKGGKATAAAAGGTVRQARGGIENEFVL